MKPFYLLVFALFCAGIGYAQDYTWSTTTGGSGSDRGAHLITDAQGNVYTTGAFSGTIDLDPGTGVTSYSTGNVAVYVTKTSSTGTFIWGKAFVGLGFAYGQAIGVDANQNVYITGHFTSSIDFNPDAGIQNLSSGGSRDIYLVKLNSSGTLAWANRFGSFGDDIGYGLAADGQGNVYITGHTSGSVDMDPSINVSATNSGGTKNIFIAKYSTAGAFLFLNKMTGTADQLGKSLTLDSANNLYATGWFEGIMEYNSSQVLNTVTSAGSSDAWVAKLSSNGNINWLKKFGGASPEVGFSVAVDKLGGVYTTGSFAGTADFDPSNANTFLTATGLSDAYLSKLDTSGNFVWARRFGGAGANIGHGVAVDAQNQVYTVGFFTGSADFDAGAGTRLLLSNGAFDIFVTKYNSLGIHQWSESIGGLNEDVCYGIAANSNGNVFMNGYFRSTVDFNPGASTASASSNGDDDVFLLRLSQPLILSDKVVSISGERNEQKANIHYKILGISEILPGSLVLERSLNGIDFNLVEQISLNQSSGIVVDEKAGNNPLQTVALTYRMSWKSLAHRQLYSNAVLLRANSGRKDWSLQTNLITNHGQLIINSQVNGEAILIAPQGSNVKRMRIQTGVNRISLDNLSAGVYHIVFQDRSERFTIQ